MLDLVIKGATLVDGTGAPQATSDLGVRDGRVVARGQVDEAARETVDADGALLTPGWVDVHTHYGSTSTPTTTVRSPGTTRSTLPPRTASPRS
jgi:N-acyl-D-aspartate/D-glutamate deacylase